MTVVWKILGGIHSSDAFIVGQVFVPWMHVKIVAAVAAATVAVENLWRCRSRALLFDFDWLEMVHDGNECGKVDGCYRS